jgi:hypothetical protein
MISAKKVRKLFNAVPLPEELSADPYSMMWRQIFNWHFFSYLKKIFWLILCSKIWGLTVGIPIDWPQLIHVEAKLHFIFTERMPMITLGWVPLNFKEVVSLAGQIHNWHHIWVYKIDPLSSCSQADLMLKGAEI